jgi:hypothetical protein
MSHYRYIVFWKCPHSNCSCINFREVTSTIYTDVCDFCSLTVREPITYTCKERLDVRTRNNRESTSTTKR